MGAGTGALGLGAGRGAKGPGAGAKAGTKVTEAAAELAELSPPVADELTAVWPALDTVPHSQLIIISKFV